MLIFIPIFRHVLVLLRSVESHCQNDSKFYLSIWKGMMQNMKTGVIKKNNTEVAVVSSEELLITDVQSALDLIMTVKYETGCTNMVVNKEAVVNDFFVLSTCLAGEIMQKFINYGVRFAIYGDFSKYTSKPLKDLMYECNQGKDMYFQPTASLAVDKLSGCA